MMSDGATERILRMGKESWRVFTVGFPALDLIEEKLYATPEEVYDRYNSGRALPLFLPNILPQ